MGGGSSKLNAGEGVVVPVKIRPLLLRRFEEFRKRRNGGTLKIEGTLSKKQLLKDSPDEEDGNSQTFSENETETRYKDNEKEKEQVKEEIRVVISIEKISRVVPLPNTECECKCKCKCKCESEEEKEENKEEKDTNTVQNNQEKVFHVDDLVEVHEEEKMRENEQEVDAKSDDEDDDNDDDSEERGRLVYPGSPSFRIYCIETESRKEEEEEESKNETIACMNETIVVHKKSASADSIHSNASRISRNSNEVTQIVEIESTRKRKGMKKFGAVRTLLKVKSCYHPMSSRTGDDRRRLLVAKTN